MKIIPFIIVVMCLFHFSVFSQNTGQVTLSIRLYPIQIIEVDPSNTQSSEDSDLNLLDISYSSHLSTYSTSQYSLKVDTVKNYDIDVLQTTNTFNFNQNSSSINSVNAVRQNEDYEKNYHIVYSMETL